MEYKLTKHIRATKGTEVIDIITIQAISPDGKIEKHDFLLEQGEDLKQASIKHSAELEQIPKETIIENIPIAKNLEVIKSIDIKL